MTPQCLSSLKRKSWASVIPHQSVTGNGLPWWMSKGRGWNSPAYQEIHSISSVMGAGREEEATAAEQAETGERLWDRVKGSRGSGNLVSLSGSSLRVLWKWKSLSYVRLFVSPWTVAHQAPLSRGFSRQESWSGLPLPSPGDLPTPGIKPGSPALQADSLPFELQGSPETWNGASQRTSWVKVQKWCALRKIDAVFLDTKGECNRSQKG